MAALPPKLPVLRSDHAENPQNPPQHHSLTGRKASPAVSDVFGKMLSEVEGDDIDICCSNGTPTLDFAGQQRGPLRSSSPCSSRSTGSELAGCGYTRRNSVYAATNAHSGEERPMAAATPLTSVPLVTLAPAMAWGERGGEGRKREGTLGSNDPIASTGTSGGTTGRGKRGSGASAPPSPGLTGRSVPDSVSPAMMALTAHIAMLLRPLPLPTPATPFFRCFIERKGGGLLNFGSPNYAYHLYAEDDGRFLMATQRKAKTANGSNYWFVADPDVSLCQDRAKAGPKAVGKLRANVSGSSYMIYDAGEGADEASSYDDVRAQLGEVQFLYGAVGPGHFRVAIPAIDDTGNPRSFKEHQTLTARGSAAVVPERSHDLVSAALAHDRKLVIELGNKAPEWDAASKSFQLRFGGRVKLASVKNFQASLLDDSEVSLDEMSWKGAAGHPLLQFGRVSKDRFIMDVAYPLSIFQGFAITIATLDPKLSENAAFNRFKGKASPGLFASKSAK